MPVAPWLRGSRLKQLSCKSRVPFPLEHTLHCAGVPGDREGGPSRAPRPAPASRAGSTCLHTCGCAQSRWPPPPAGPEPGRPGVTGRFASEAGSSSAGPREPGRGSGRASPRGPTHHRAPVPHTPGSRQRGWRAPDDARPVVPGGALRPAGGDVCLCWRESEDGEFSEVTQVGRKRS